MISRKPRLAGPPVTVTLLVITVGMLFSIFWSSFTEAGYFQHFWSTPGDIWATYRTAHWIGWGDYGGLYGATGQFYSTPGIAIVLAPVAVLTHALGLSETFPLAIPHPTAWLVLGPVEMLLGCTSLFAVDSLARRFGVSRARRWALCLVEGLMLWPIIVLWGHPEDAVATALCLYALVLVLDGRWAAAAWVVGAGIAFQPLVVMALPVMIAVFLLNGDTGHVRVGRLSSAAPFVARAFGPSIALLSVPLLADPRDTLRAIVEQAQTVSLARVTPWTSVAPHLEAGVVSSGPMRMAAIAGSCVLGFVTYRLAPGPARLVWCAAICLGLRFVTESTLEPYYIWPALALFVAVSATGSRTRFLATCLISGGLTLSTDMHFSHWWTWWTVSVLGLVLVSISSAPPRSIVAVPGRIRTRAQAEPAW